MNSKVALRLKNSEPTMVEPQASQLIAELGLAIGDYAVFGSRSFDDKAMFVYDMFIDKFLQTHAIVGSSEATQLRSFDPYHIAFTDILSHDEFGPMKQWLAYYSNCFLLYTEYDENPDLNELLFCIDKATYETSVKAKEEPS